MGSAHFRTSPLLLALILSAGNSLAVPAVAQITYYVSPCGDDGWNGTSPACEAPDGPKATIMAAISVARNGDTVELADGVYTGAANKYVSFSGRAITLRSANGPDNCIIDLEGEGRAFTFSAQEVLEGVTMRNGVGSASGAVWCLRGSQVFRNCAFANNRSQNGGALYAEDSASPTLMDCQFVGNWADSDGGGAYFRGRTSAPTLIHCVFIDNFAGSDGGGFYARAESGGSSTPTLDGCVFIGNRANNGGGVYARAETTGGTSIPFLTDCTFRQNRATSNGGGIYTAASTGQGISRPKLTRCTFSGNSANGGGGLYCRASTRDGLSAPEISLCVFSGNSAGAGGGAYTRASTTNGVSMPEFVNCLFIDNSGGGLYCGTSTRDGFASLLLINCTFTGNAGGGLRAVSPKGAAINSIFWGNAPPQLSVASIDVSFSVVQGGFPGLGNVSDDPMLTGGGRLAPGSSAIDAGDNTAVPMQITSDIDGFARFVDEPETPDTGRGTPPIVDIGAFELQSCHPCDMNCDGNIDVFDIEPFIGLLMGATPCGVCTGDVDGNGQVDPLDIEPFLRCLLP